MISITLFYDKNLDASPIMNGSFRCFLTEEELRPNSSNAYKNSFTLHNRLKGEEYLELRNAKRPITFFWI